MVLKLRAVTLFIDALMKNIDKITSKTPEAAWVLALAVTVATSALYAATAYPTVAGGDSAEVVAMAYELGVPHPPGYPLYTLTSHAWTRYILTFSGDVAYRCNLLAGLCGGIAAGVLSFIVAKWTGSLAGGLLTGGIYATSKDVWLYSTHGEVFGLNNLLTAWMLYLTVEYCVDPTKHSVAYQGAFVLGLGS